MNCPFCARACKNALSLAMHGRCCDNNPEQKPHVRQGKTGHTGGNQYTVAKRLGISAPPLSDETRNRLAESARRENQKRFADPAFRQRFCESMQRAVERNPRSYGVSNRGRTRKIEKHGLAFQGKWELYFFEWCLAQEIAIERVTQSFHYEWNGQRRYFPDFFLPEHDCYVEVKGYQTDKDIAKWQAFPHRLLVIRREQIEQIARGQFDIKPLLNAP